MISQKVKDFSKQIQFFQPWRSTIVATVSLNQNEKPKMDQMAKETPTDPNIVLSQLFYSTIEDY